MAEIKNSIICARCGAKLAHALSVCPGCSARLGGPGSRKDRRASSRLKSILFQIVVALLVVELLFLPLFVMGIITEHIDGMEVYRAHLIFETDGETDYFVVERWDNRSDGIIDIAFYPDTNTFNITVDNIRSLSVNVRKLWQDNFDEFKSALEEYGIDEDDRGLFLVWADVLHIIVHADTGLIDNLTLAYVPKPERVTVNGAEFTNYRYIGEARDIVITSLPAPDCDVYIYFTTTEVRELGMELPAEEPVAVELTSIPNEPQTSEAAAAAAGVMVTSTTALTAIVISRASQATITVAGGKFAGFFGVIINRVRDFFFELSEESLRRRTSKLVDAEGPSFITPREVGVITLTIIVMGLAYAYVCMMEIISPVSAFLIHAPQFSVPIYIAMIPIAITTSTLIIVSSELMGEISARLQGIWSEFRIWTIGFITLFISAVLFLMPFGYPGKADYRSTMRVPPDIYGKVALSKMLILLVLPIPFYLMYMYGYTLVGTIGITCSLMIFCYDMFPFKPLEGREIYDWNKAIWAVAFITGILLFYGWVLALIPPIIYLLTSGAGAVGLTVLLVTLYQTRMEVPLVEVISRPDIAPYTALKDGKVVYDLTGERYVYAPPSPAEPTRPGVYVEPETGIRWEPPTIPIETAPYTVDWKFIEAKEPARAEYVVPADVSIYEQPPSYYRRRIEPRVEMAGYTARQCPQCGTTVEETWYLCPKCDYRLRGLAADTATKRIERVSSD